MKPHPVLEKAEIWGGVKTWPSHSWVSVVLKQLLRAQSRLGNCPESREKGQRGNAEDLFNTAPPLSPFQCWTFMWLFLWRRSIMSRKLLETLLHWAASPFEEPKGALDARGGEHWTLEGGPCPCAVIVGHVAAESVRGFPMPTWRACAHAHAHTPPRLPQCCGCSGTCLPPLVLLRHESQKCICQEQRQH